LATAPIPPPDAAHGLRPDGPAPAEGLAAEALKRVPPLRAERQCIREHAASLAARLDRSRPLARLAIEGHARAILAELGLPEGYVGWTMVAVASAFWRDQVEAIPPDRRLLLLPHCLRNSERCNAEYNQLGLLCRDCGACRLTDLRAVALARGYQVLIAEGSPTVIEIILRGHADAILGAACLNSLEKSLEKILLAGVPCMAVPLLNNSCRDTSTDEDWVREMIDTPYRRGAARSQSYVHLLRAATGLFDSAELERLVPRLRLGPAPAEGNGDGLEGLDPVAATEAIARHFLLLGGKHFRPFITLAAYDAMTGAQGAGPEGTSLAALLPDAVKRVALAIEVFHKASLIHDDIEDDDPFRYGHPALHRRFGTPMAINVGDYLIGLGYRLVAAEREHLPAPAIADVLGHLAEAHTKLCEGQGAELAWRRAQDKRIAPLEALKIYALKTAPAFEAALRAGLRLAGPIEPLAEPAARFARHLGVGFQVLNDLEDWEAEQPNKRATGTDALAGRPTILWAMAMERLDPPERRRLEELVARPQHDPAAVVEVVESVRGLYQRAGVYRQARELVARHRQRAHALADSVTLAPLAHLLHYLADIILRG